MTKPWIRPAGLARMRGITLSAVYQGLWAGRYRGARKTKEGWRIPLEAIEGRSKTPERPPDPAGTAEAA